MIMWSVVVLLLLIFLPQWNHADCMYTTNRMHCTRMADYLLRDYSQHRWMNSIVLIDSTVSNPQEICQLLPDNLDRLVFRNVTPLATLCNHTVNCVEKSVNEIEGCDVVTEATSTLWSPWSPCTKSCGSSATKSRTCSGTDCEAAEESTFCPFKYCSPGPWKSWGECTVSCSIGIRERIRPCDEDCGNEPLYDSVQCINAPCEPTTWESWSECSTSCGDGERIRSRTCDGDCGDLPMNEQQDCNIKTCISKPNPWTQWNDCSKTCGKGDRTRTRTCDDQCGTAPLIQIRSCNEQKCIGAWTSWSSCNATCGPGYRHRTRDCHHHRSCDPQIEEQCRRRDCEPLAWADWSSCDEDCGPGERFRLRACEIEGRCHQHNLTKKEACNIKPCIKYGLWGDWGSCSKTCGVGERTRHRICISGECLHTSDTEFCSVQECPRWGAWSLWTKCSTTCRMSNSMIQRVRKCETVHCLGPTEQTKPCPNLPSCVTDWVEWSQCSTSCGIGTQTRRRSCLSPQCEPDDFRDSKSCNITDCVSAWSSWSNCSECDALQERSRYCKSAPCHQKLQDDRPCKNSSCESTYLPWSDWTGCDQRCGVQSDRYRNRTCLLGQCLVDPSDSEEWQQCTPNSCSIWTKWETWSVCSITCGDGGHRGRQRYCRKGDRCSGEYYQDNRPCADDNPPCEKVTAWAEWQTWGGCSTTCSDTSGIKVRARHCDKLIITDSCMGPSYEMKSCESIQNDTCVWATWNACTVSCGVGIQTRRQRDCDRISPCFDPTEQEQICKIFCDVQWSEWTPCKLNNPCDMEQMSYRLNLRCTQVEDCATESRICPMYPCTQPITSSISLEMGIFIGFSVVGVLLTIIAPILAQVYSQHQANRRFWKGIQLDRQHFNDQLGYSGLNLTPTFASALNTLNNSTWNGSAIPLLPLRSPTASSTPTSLIPTPPTTGASGTSNAHYHRANSTVDLRLAPSTPPSRPSHNRISQYNLDPFDEITDL